MSKKLHVLAHDKEDLPRAFWSENFPKLADYEIIDLPLDQETLRPLWQEVLKTSSGILIDRRNSSGVLQLLKSVPRGIAEVQCVDLLTKDPMGNWWPHCVYRDTLHSHIISVANNLDTSCVAYISGAGPIMRVCMSVLVQLGYGKINLILENPDEHESLSDSFKRLYFDTTITLMRNTDLTLQKNDGTILINTMPLSQHPDLKDDLTYLNFIFGAGLVVDTQGDQISNPVLDEATHVGLRVLNGYRLQAVTDYRVLCQLLGPSELSEEDFVKKWKEHLQKNSPDEKPAEGPVTNKGS